MQTRYRRFGWTLRRALAFVVLTVAGVGTSALAQYPNRPVRVIVPFPAGGAADTITRIIAQPLGQALGQQVLVDNRPGADGAIAASAVMHAPADGYTLFMATSSALSAVPAMRKVPPYDPDADFTPISKIGTFSFFLYVNPAVPASTVGELVTYIRSQPGKVNFAGATSTGTMAAVEFASSAKLDMVRVPYKGEAAATIDLVSGQVQLMFATPTNAGAAAADGRLKVLATLLPQRSSALPDVPTMRESGVPGASIVAWAGLFGPARLPPEIVGKLHRELNSVLNQPKVREQIALQAVEVQGSTPEELSAYMKQQLESWKAAVRDSGVALE
jgi:tripartite-type tricarboxylate transporter receptor subunit TctC